MTAPSSRPLLTPPLRTRILVGLMGPVASSPPEGVGLSNMTSTSFPS